MIGSKKKIGRQCCWDYSIGGSGYIFMLLKVVGKLPKFGKISGISSKFFCVYLPHPQ